MDVTDRQNWILSGVVRSLLVANGVARFPTRSSLLELVLVGALVTGGLLATLNAVTAVTDPSSDVERDWTTRKTAINAVAVVLLTATLVVQMAVLVG